MRIERILRHLGLSQQGVRVTAARAAPEVAERVIEPWMDGGLEQALHLEHMTLLWVRMVRVNGASPHMVWAALKR